MCPEAGQCRRCPRVGAAAGGCHRRRVEPLQAWGGWGTGAQGGRCPEVLLGMQWDPGGQPLQGRIGRGSGEVSLMLGEGVPGQRRREETVQWGRFGEGDGHSYRTRPGRPAAPLLIQTLPSCSSDWVLGLPLRPAGLGSVGECQGDRCRVGAWGGGQYVRVYERTMNNSPQNCTFITVSHIFHLMVTGWVSRSRCSERI